MAERHFYEQRNHTLNYLLPYLETHIPDFYGKRVLEVGCAEGGFLDVLQKKKMVVMGVELLPHRVKIALDKNPNLKIVIGDITTPDIVKKLGMQFDVIVLRDVIEHIPDRQALFTNITRLLQPGGYVYVSFPPRFSPFAGHQQNFRSILRFIPFLHFLPAWGIRLLGKTFHENPRFTEEVILNYTIGLTISAFERYCQQFHFRPVVKGLFLIRPIYRTRFGVPIKRLPSIPVLREVFVMGCECLLQWYPT